MWDGTATLGMTSLLLLTGAVVPAAAATAVPVVRGTAYRSDLLDSIDAVIGQVEGLQARCVSGPAASELSYSEAPDVFAYEDALRWERVAIELKTAPRTYEAFSEKPDSWL